MRFRQGPRRRPAAAHAGRRARGAGAGPLAAVRLVEPGDRLPGPRLRLVGRIRLLRRDAHGPGGGRAAARPDSRGRMPDPRTREGMPDLYAYAHLLAGEKRRRPGHDVMSI